MIRRLPLFLTLVSAFTLSAPATAQEDWTLLIHGGAGTLERENMTPETEAEIRAALRAALDSGSAVLARGGSALDAVEASVRVLEDNPNFNAGRGAVFTAEGTNELDASIMDGRGREAGAVAGVTMTRHPIALARAVMENSPHVLLAGRGADQFSRDQKLEQVGPEWFYTQRRFDQLQRFLERENAVDREAAAPHPRDDYFGTVGAAARDSEGNLAAATSTGGRTGKAYGRVGDSPIIGAGTYADNRACAVSATGAGEYYIREGVAHEICARMRFLGEGPQEAADHVQADTLALGGDGGVIVVGADGRWAFSFNTRGMYRGMASGGVGSGGVGSGGGERLVAIFGEE